MKPRTLYLLCLFSALVIFTGCRNSTEPGTQSKKSLLVRSWTLTEINPPGASNSTRPGSILSFREDNTVLISHQDGTETKFSWKFTDNETRLVIGVGTAEILELSPQRMQLKILEQPKMFVETYTPYTN